VRPCAAALACGLALQRMDVHPLFSTIYLLFNSIFMNRYFDEDKRATAEICGEPEPTKVCLAWGSRKRHLFVNDVLLCEKRFETAGGYSRKGGHSISYQIAGLPTYQMTTPDQKFSHGDGIIPALPLDEIKIGDGGISRKSICAACQKRYDKLFIPTSSFFHC
jgi:hypothetical protein